MTATPDLTFQNINIRSVTKHDTNCEDLGFQKGSKLSFKVLNDLDHDYEPIMPTQRIKKSH
jgi:hypothetical protein